MMRCRKSFLIILLMGLPTLFSLQCSKRIRSKDNQLPVKEVISSVDAPDAIGPYSQAIKVGDMLFCSGQIAINPATGELVTDNIETETRQVLQNLKAVLNEAGMDFDDVVRATIFMSDINNYTKINEVYAEYFMDKPPARAAVQVVALPKLVNVEISCIAVKSE